MKVNVFELGQFATYFVVDKIGWTRLTVKENIGNSDFIFIVDNNITKCAPNTIYYKVKEYNEYND